MNLFTLSLALGIAFALRIGFLAVHLNRLNRLWYDFDHGGLSYRLAQFLDILTFLGFFACVGYAFWTLPDSEVGIAPRYAMVFVAWFGLTLLARLTVHRFPRTNAPLLFDEAKVSLFTNLLLALLNGLTLTGLTAIYFWLRG